MPPAITAMVRPVRIAPLCAAVSMPRASPETTTTVAARSAASVSAMRWPLAEALRPPTAATHRLPGRAMSPRTIRQGGASSIIASNGG